MHYDWCLVSWIGSSVYFSHAHYKSHEYPNFRHFFHSIPSIFLFDSFCDPNQNRFVFSILTFNPDIFSNDSSTWNNIVALFSSLKIAVVSSA